MRRALIAIVTLGAIGFMVVFLAFRSDVFIIDTVAIHYAMNVTTESVSPREATIIQTELLTQIFDDMETAQQSRDDTLQIAMYLLVFAFVVGGALLCLYYHRRVIKPFRKLENFAQNVAVGRLDAPLEMDKDNLFGAFTESFDLMREELRIAKENEIKASKSKKELVASLVHDINTPVASVRSAMDILRLKADDETQIKILDAANKKLEQIDELITNLFHSTLEELQKLKVATSEIGSVDVYEIITQADFEGRCRGFSIPNCIIIADPMRLQQVFDNIIKNSYKYADTDIFINAHIEEEYLFVEVCDFGLGVLEKELPLITAKFYRGKNTEKTDGYGLGLYLSKYFMEQMAGGLYPENLENGFMVVIMLRLA